MVVAENRLVSAFTDEAGARVLVRKLTDSTDAQVSLLCSLLIPNEHVAYVSQLFKVPFDKFRTAAPAGAKLHITDAFRPGHEEWRKVAEEVRAEILTIMKDNGVFLTYSARRLQVSREMHEILENAKKEAQANKRSDYVVKNANRPSTDQVDDDVMINLALMADAFVEMQGRQRVDFLFDEIERSVADRYRDAILLTQRATNFKEEVEAREKTTGKNAKGEIRLTAPQNMATKHLGSVAVVGKDDPIILAVDVVTNSLWRHLQSLPATNPLNVKLSISGWPLEDLTFVAPERSMFDVI